MTVQTMLIHQNNTTLVSLQRRDYHNAVVSSTATTRLLQELRRMQSQDIVASANSFDSVDEYMLLSGDVSSDEQTDVHDDDTPFVYEHGIAIPSTAVPFEVISSIIIFNCALAHQLLAQEQQCKATSQQCLIKAKRLYGLASQTFGHVVDRSLLFQFAVLNNIAVIELLTGNKTLSDGNFERLMSIFMLLVDSDSTSKLHLLRGFVRNFPVQVKAASAA